MPRRTFHEIVANMASTVDDGHEERLAEHVALRQSSAAVSPIDGLGVFSGFQCKLNGCFFACRQESSLRGHRRTVHKESVSLPGDIEELARRCTVQLWYRGNGVFVIPARPASLEQAPCRHDLVRATKRLPRFAGAQPFITERELHKEIAQPFLRQFVAKAWPSDHDLFSARLVCMPGDSNSVCLVIQGRRVCVEAFGEPLARWCTAKRSLVHCALRDSRRKQASMVVHS